jgi:hypothetical protein
MLLAYVSSLASSRFPAVSAIFQRKASIRKALSSYDHRKMHPPQGKLADCAEAPGKLGNHRKMVGGIRNNKARPGTHFVAVIKGERPIDDWASGRELAGNPCPEQKLKNTMSS